MCEHANVNRSDSWHHVSPNELKQLVKSPISHVREFSMDTKGKAKRFLRGKQYISLQWIPLSILQGFMALKRIKSLNRNV